MGFEEQRVPAQASERFSKRHITKFSGGKELERLPVDACNAKGRQA